MDKGSQCTSPNFSPSVFTEVPTDCEHAFSCCWLTFQWLDLCPAKGHTVQTSVGHTVDDLGARKSILCRYFLCADMRMYILLHVHINIWMKQIPRSLIKLVHTHVTGKRAAFAWGWSVGIGEYGFI